LQTFAVALALGGFVAIYANKNVKGKPHFTTWHASFGVLTLLLTAASLVLGALSFNRLGVLRHVPEQHRLAVKYVHRTCGGGAVGLGCVTILTAANHPAVSVGVATEVSWALFVLGIGAGLVKLLEKRDASAGTPNRVELSSGEKKASEA
jgi:cytochrome b-561 domain-containing protein 2